MNKELFASIIEKPAASVEVAEWGHTVHLRVMSQAERMVWLANPDGEPQQAELSMRKLLAMSICDDQGKRIFGDGDDDLKVIADRSHLVLERLIKESLRINGMDKQSDENIAKNSEAGGSNSPSSDSPAT
jgi:hypothetical protein